MRGRTKGNAEAQLVVAWIGEALARSKRLRPVESYLKPKAKGGSGEVAARLKKLAKDGAKVVVRRITVAEDGKE